MTLSSLQWYLSGMGWGFLLAGFIADLQNYTGAHTYYGFAVVILTTSVLVGIYRLLWLRKEIR